MRGEVEFTGPEVALVLGTRAALGIGLGLLLADRFTEEGRRTVGRTLLLAGTFAAAIVASELFGRPRHFQMAFGAEQDARERRAHPSERNTVPTM